MSKSQKVSEKSIIKSKAKSAAAVLVAAALVISCRLIDIQLIHSDTYKKYATAAQWNEEPIVAERGAIYDAQGNVLAKSAGTWKLYLIPENFRDDDFRSQVCHDVADTLELDYDELIELCKAEKAEEGAQVIAHRKDVKAQMELDEKKLVDCGAKSAKDCNTNCLMHRSYKKTTYVDGKASSRTYKYSEVMGLEQDSKRYYPMEEFASSVVGFVNADVNVDGNGVSGLEGFYNTLLSGHNGKITSYGSNINGKNETRFDAKDGTSLVLTIDETVQYCLHDQLTSVYKSSGGIGAYGVVMDVKTGGILGLDCVGYKGSYNLNSPTELNSYYENRLNRSVNNDNFENLEEYLSKKEGGEAELEAIENTEDYDTRLKLHSEKLHYYFMMEQWNNYMVSETYHPGSVFKIFLTAAAIEENALGDDFSYSCGGSIAIEDRIFNCHQGSGHGPQNLREGLMHSCNPFFIKVGLTLGAERFFKYFKAFGFTEKTGIELPGEANPIYYNEDQLTRVALASESFGQTFSITPMQMITAISSIANGGYLMRPYIVAQEIDSEGNVVSKTEPVVRRQVISSDTAAQVASMMEDVVKSGTGKNGYVAGYRVAGKTGTTQKYQLKGTYIASFGCFAPADNPEIAVLIIVDEPVGEINGSTVCAPAAAKVVETVLEYLGVERQYTENEMEDLDTSTPGVIGKDVNEAEDILEQAGFGVRVVGDGDKVVSQSPAGGQTIPKGGVVALYTAADEERLEVTVPDLSGRGINEVKRFAASEGLNVRIFGNAGSGVVSYDQSTAPGETVEYGSIIMVYFKSYQDVGDT